jgi:ribokinase
VAEPRPVRLAVVGHVEWVDFVPVAHHPRAGEVLHADGGFARAAGGGGVVAAVFAELGADVDFFCALGDDAHGQAAADELAGRGVNVQAAWRRQATRRAVTLLEGRGERTIVTIGERLDPLGSDPLAWERLGCADGVYFTAGDPEALRRARAAAVVVASPRARTALAQPGPEIDALVFSAHDADEAQWAGRIEHRARLLVCTEGARGGRWWSSRDQAPLESGRWQAVPPPGPVRDSYGCGDSFAAGFTFALARGAPVAEAAALGAECGARCLTRAGAP